MKHWNDNDIAYVVYKLKGQCIDSGEADLMFAIYEQALLDCHNRKKTLHAERICKRTYENRVDKELKRLELFLSEKVILTQKNLDILMNATRNIQTARVRVMGIEKKITRLTKLQEQDFKFLTNEDCWTLYYAGIEPLYAIRLLNEIEFFK